MQKNVAIQRITRTFDNQNGVLELVTARGRVIKTVPFHSPDEENAGRVNLASYAQTSGYIVEAH